MLQTAEDLLALLQGLTTTRRVTDEPDDLEEDNRLEPGDIRGPGLVPVPTTTARGHQARCG